MIIIIIIYVSMLWCKQGLNELYSSQKQLTNLQVLVVTNRVTRIAMVQSTHILMLYIVRE